MARLLKKAAPADVVILIGAAVNVAVISALLIAYLLA